MIKDLKELLFQQYVCYQLALKFSDCMVGRLLTFFLSLGFRLTQVSIHNCV